MATNNKQKINAKIDALKPNGATAQGNATNGFTRPIDTAIGQHLQATASGSLQNSSKPNGLQVIKPTAQQLQNNIMQTPTAQLSQGNALNGFVRPIDTAVGQQLQAMASGAKPNSTITQGNGTNDFTRPIDTPIGQQLQAMASGTGNLGATINQGNGVSDFTRPIDTPLGQYLQSQASGLAQNNGQASNGQQSSQNSGGYQSQWQAQVDDVLNRIMNREDFSYDLNGDALYQMYKDQYMLQGQQAMMDTMGQAAAMTGGYGNSYAQGVGQQAYQGYLQQLNDRVPELYQLALDQYNREGENLYNQYGLYMDRENQDYGRYMDTVANQQWQQQFDYNAQQDSIANQQWQQQFEHGVQQDNISNEQWQQAFDYGAQQDAISNEQWQQAFDYGAQQDAIGNQQWQQAFDYNAQQDAISNNQWQQAFDTGNSQWEQEFGFNQEQANIQNNQWQQQFDAVYGNGSSNSNNGGSDRGYNYDTHGYTRTEIMALQSAAGITVDGIWGPNTEAAYQAGWRPTSTAANSAVTGGLIGTDFVGNTNSNGFTGSTYSEAAAYLRANGLDASGLMTASEWARHHNGNNSAGGEHEASSYQEYLAAYIYGKTKK